MNEVIQLTARITQILRSEGWEFIDQNGWIEKAIHSDTGTTIHFKTSDEFVAWLDEKGQEWEINLKQYL